MGNDRLIQNINTLLSRFFEEKSPMLRPSPSTNYCQAFILSSGCLPGAFPPPRLGPSPESKAVCLDQNDVRLFRVTFFLQILSRLFVSLRRHLAVVFEDKPRRKLYLTLKGQVRVRVKPMNSTAIFTRQCCKRVLKILCVTVPPQKVKGIAHACCKICRKGVLILVRRKC